MENVTEVPEGPVTIMFTDVEGSTSLRTTLGDTGADALFKQHDELVREQIEAHKGQDQKAALGDGFLAVFRSTRRAVSCAIAIQRALEASNRTRSGPPLKVRVGLNTGEAAFVDGQLSGEAVHAAARVCAAGDGGQILVSDVTRQLAGTVPDVIFADAGEHRLKGFAEPWRLWDVVWIRETSSVPEPVFVGRTEELAALRSRLNDALDGQGGMVLVGGEPGVGKTALVRQLIREAEQRGALAVFGRCYESEGAVLYSPFVEMLEQALSLMPADIVREDLGEDAPEVARMVPELRRRFPDIGEPLDLPPEQQRRYFFNAVSSFIARGAQRFPLVLVMDDVHWADEPTLLLIEHMAKLAPELPVLGIGTYRNVELEVARPLAASIERMLRERTLERIAVERFDRDGVAGMIEALSSKAPPEPIVEAIYAETEGNPFFVEEVYRHFIEEGKVFDETGAFRADIEIDELDVPESVRLVVGRRLERLGTEAQKVLAVGAVVGRAFSFSLLEELSDADAGQLLDVVDDAEAARVIVSEERDGEVQFSFAHELIRQTLLSNLSILRRQRLHLAVAEAIQRLDPAARQERPSEVANHLLQAGSAADQELLLSYLESASQRALDAAAFEEALRTLDDALSVVDADDASRIAHLLHLQGTALRALGDFDRCLEVWATALELYEQVGNARGGAHLAWQMGYLQTWLARFEDAYVSYSRGLEVIGQEEAPERVLCHSGLIAFSGFIGAYDDAARHYREAIALAERLGDHRAIGVAEWSWCIAEWTFMRIPQATEAGRRAVAHLKQSKDAWTLVDALAWLSFPLLWSGEIDEARSVAEEAVELAQRLGHIGEEALARRTVALAEVARGSDLDAFIDAAEKDVEMLHGIDSPWVGMSHSWLSVALSYRGDLEGSLREARTAQDLEPTSAWEGFGWYAEVLASALAGDTERCREMLDGLAVEDAGPDDPTPGGPLFKLHGGAMAAALIGSEDHAVRLYPLLMAHKHRLRYLAFELSIADRVAGMLASTAGLWEEAASHFAEAERIVEEAPHPIDRPHLDHWYGKMLLDRGRPEDRETAIAKLTAARDEFTSRGMPRYIELVDELLGE